MLNQSLKTEIQQAYSQFLASKSLKPRLGQKQMIAEIARSLAAIKTDAEGMRSNHAGLLAIEAGTGTGKTVAYTLAALPIAKALGKKLIISTATVALQEQIIYRDLPDILKHSGLHFRYALAKGRSRYLCLSKLDTYMQANPQDHLFDADQSLASELDQQQQRVMIYESMAKALLKGEWTGDKDDWQDPLEPEIWQPLTSDRNQCTGRRCQHVNQCSFFKAREELSAVDCIVANHDLVMADLALGGGAILAAPEDSIYIFDEAHHLPDIALRHFACNLRVHAANSWLDQSIKSIHDTGQSASSFVSLLDELDRALACLVQLKPLYAALKDQVELLCEPLLPVPEYESLPNLRFEHGEIPAALEQLANKLKQQQLELVNVLSAAHGMLEEAIDSNHSGLSLAELEQLFANFGQMLAVAERYHEVFQAYAKPPAELPDSRWVQLIESAGLIEFDLCASPLMPASALAQFLWQRCYAAILSSATLTALGSFDRLAMQAGLPDYYQSAIAPSPFNYADNAIFSVPQMSVEPLQKYADQHTDEIARLLPKLAEGFLAVLVLFSSKRQMNAVFELMAPDWQQKILRQSDLSKQALIEKHKTRVDQKQQSLIFGLASLAEGIDLPGDYCSHVVIAKLPFSVPNAPVDAALAEWLESQGRNPFMEISLPEASQKLIQACGRLIRTEQDVGKISLLDKRVLTKRYGKQLLAALPPFKQELDVSL